MNPSEHRVSSHLQLHVADYDRLIRTWIPGYDTMLDTIVGLLDAALPADPLVVDLGAGTGALSGAILDRIPRARVRLVDIDPNMLEVAASRVAHHGARAELARATFDDALPACDAVVATLALHHVAEPAHKRALFERVRAALRPGGMFVVGDATIHESGRERTWAYDAWARHMAASGIDRAEADKLFATWEREDFLRPLVGELAMIADAGFGAPDCFWKHGPMAVYGAFAG
jgi:tRNA (cmo5U34)-methyltransferase